MKPTPEKREIVDLHVDDAKNPRSTFVSRYFGQSVLCVSLFWREPVVEKSLLEITVFQLLK